MTESLNANQILINKLKEIILANLGNENFGVKELARESGMSRYLLTNRLQAITNKTINQFIREVRLQKAFEMLRNEEFTVSEVAYKTGFGSPAYFTSSFHEFFGYPPGKVKKESLERHEDLTFAPEVFIKKSNRIKSRKIGLTSTIILSLFVIAFLVYTLLTNKDTENTTVPIAKFEKSIAVLPFKNLSDNSLDQYVYDGVMEEIFNNLSKVKELRVISRTSVEQYRNTTKTIPCIGKELDVNYIVEGSGQRSGNIFRLRVQLIDVSSDRHIWSESYQRRIKEPTKLFRIQSQVAMLIASELKTTINPEEKKLMEKVPTENMTAYDLYLKANDYQKVYEKTRDPGSYKTTLNLYNSALETDTAFARAYTGLANAYFTRYRWETYFKENYLDSINILADKALSIDNQLDEAYFLKAQYYRLNGQTEAALYNYDKAIEINPNYYAAYERKGYLLTWVLGDFVKGFDNCYKALNLVGGSERAALLKVLGRAYLDMGFREKASNCYNEAFILDGNKVSYLNSKAFLEFCLENFEVARKLWKQVEEIDPTSTGIQNYYYFIPGHNIEAYNVALKDIENLKRSGSLNLVRSHRTGYAFWQVGKKKEADYYFSQQIRYSEESIKLSRDIQQRKSAYYDLAATYAFLGDKEKAYKYLDEYSQKYSFALPFVIFAKYDLLFASIRKEERFQKILQIIESKYLAEQKRVKKWLEDQDNL